MVYVYTRIANLHMHKVSRETYNRRGMSNMQLNDGPHGAWAGACRTSSEGPRALAVFERSKYTCSNTCRISPGSEEGLVTRSYSYSFMRYTRAHKSNKSV